MIVFHRQYQKLTIKNQFFTMTHALAMKIMTLMLKRIKLGDREKLKVADSNMMPSQGSKRLFYFKFIFVVSSRISDPDHRRVSFGEEQLSFIITRSLYFFINRDNASHTYITWAKNKLKKSTRKMFRKGGICEKLNSNN